ncbi:MAG: phage terminase large subunit [Anaerolineae bacterium]|nr:phage terminase large subunit [Anaerolineae bacterium]
MSRSTAATLEAPQVEQEQIRYDPLPTLQDFHNSSEMVRCIVGPVGSGKTTAAAWEIAYFLPEFLFREYGIKRTRWIVVRNTYVELRDSTLRTMQYWFPGAFEAPYWSESKMTARVVKEDWEAEILFRSCDRPDHIKKLKSLEITGYWIDESIEVPEEIKNMLKNRIGRFPPKSPEKYGIETTNPPDVEHPTYSQFKWNQPPPGPLSSREPLEGHAGFWQPAGENNRNLPAGYYEELRKAYRDNPDWIDMYIDGKPGVMITGKLVFNNFRRDYHVAKEPIKWTGGELIFGWDNSGNMPACIVLQVVGPQRCQILREYFHDKMNIVDFTNHVVQQVNRDFPGAKDVVHWGDPAGNTQYAKKEGGFTSNAALMADCGVEVGPSEQNFQARIEAVDQMLARIDGVLIDPGCTRLINGFLGGYCYPPNKSLMGEYLPNVLKNKYAHLQDALQYAMVRLFKADLRPDARDPVLNLGNGRDRYDPLGGTGFDPFQWK